MEEYIPTPEETEKEKDEIINEIIPQLKIHGLVDLTDHIKKRNKPGFIDNWGFDRSVAYKLEEMGEAEVIVRKEWAEFYVKRNIYSKRHPIRFALILAAFGVAFSIIAGTVNSIVSEQLKKCQLHKDIQKLEQTHKDLSDSLTNLQHDLKVVQDSLTKYKGR